MKANVSLVAFLFLIVSCLTTHAQTPQSIDKVTISNTQFSFYTAAVPLFVKLTPDINLILSFRFISDPVSGKLTGIRGLDLSVKSTDTCFAKDTLEMSFDNGKKLKIGTASPDICNQPLSGWFLLNQDQLDTLFAGKLRQLVYTNGKKKESTPVDIIHIDEQVYFLELKKVYDKLVPKDPA